MIIRGGRTGPETWAGHGLLSKDVARKVFKPLLKKARAKRKVLKCTISRSKHYLAYWFPDELDDAIARMRGTDRIVDAECWSFIEPATALSELEDLTIIKRKRYLLAKQRWETADLKRKDFLERWEDNLNREGSPAQGHPQLEKGGR